MVSEGASSVTFSRYLGVVRATLLGGAVTYALVAPSQGAPLTYLIAGLVLLPCLASLLQIAGAAPARSGLYQLARDGGSKRRTFTVGWLLLGGVIAAIAQLAATASGQLGQLLHLSFGIEPHARLLLALLLLAVIDRELIGSSGRFRGRAAATAVALVVLVIVIGDAQLGLRLRVPPLGGTRAGFGELGSLTFLASGLWGIVLLFELREQMRRPRLALRLASFSSWVLGMLLAGGVSASLAFAAPSDWTTLGWLCATLALLLVALALLFALALLLLRRLAVDGLLPSWLGRGAKPVLGSTVASPYAAIALGVGVGILAEVWSPHTLTFASSTLLLGAVLPLLWAHLRKRSPKTTPGGLRLPLHPLFPTLALGVAALFIFMPPWAGMELALAWLTLGVLTYFAYARRHASISEATAYSVELGGAIPTNEERWTVLVATGGGTHAATLLRVAAALARARGGALIAMRIRPLVEQKTLAELREEAQDDWQALKEHVERWAPDLPTRTLIRLAPSTFVGLMEITEEEGVDLVLLGWPREIAENPGGYLVVEDAFSRTSKALAVLRGMVAEDLPEVVVATEGGPHAPTALELGWSLREQVRGGQEDPVRLVTVLARGKGEEEGRRVLVERTMEKATGVGPVPMATLRGADPRAVLHAKVDDEALLLVGASVDRVLGRSFFGGLAQEIAEGRTGPTLVVKKEDAQPAFWLRRAWDFVARPLRVLSVSERAALFSEMRHAARASTNFYVLTLLSAVIATAGLVLNSAAVIIGAMLVAPLMSPILAASHGLVTGNVYMLRRGLASTFQGVGVAVGVGTVLAILLSDRSLTAEMLARSEPNLIDLLVAVASGAAAAYAVSHKDLSAALPGVAISVALVPPLCVGGWGLGSSNLSLAGGAMLLFTTNLAAILAVGGLTFLLLGVRPVREERQLWTRRGIFAMALVILVISVPLWLSSRTAVRAIRFERLIEEHLARFSGGRVVADRVVFEMEGETLIVRGTIYAFEDISDEDIRALAPNLSAEIGAPVKLDLTLLSARHLHSTP